MSFCCRQYCFCSSNMYSKAIIKMVTLLIMSYQSAGKLIQVPRDTASKVNQTTYFNCSTDDVHMAWKIFWYHGENRVYTGYVYEGYEERVSIDINNITGASNLVIHSVKPNDAGNYKCWEDEGTKEQSSAHLVVLDDDPICESNVKLDEVIGQNTCNLKKDEVQLSCSVTYHGNIPPRMEWRKAEDGINVPRQIFPLTSPNTYNVTLILENDISLHNSSYVCQIHGTVENECKCISEVVKLSYSVDNDEVIQRVTGTSLACVANTTFNCKYRWFHGSDSVCSVACDQNVTFKEVGDYLCEAKCPIRGGSCTFVAMKVYVSPESDQVEKRIPDSAVAAYVLAVSLIIAVIVNIYLCCRSRKVNRNAATPLVPVMAPF